MPTLFPSARTHPWRWLLAVVVFSLFLAAAQRGWVAWRQLSVWLLDREQWIWADGAIATGEPVAFFAVCDFDLDGRSKNASLVITADEVYVAWLNGRLVGSNSYLPGMPVDRYDVTSYLEAGHNRIVVELRSGRGAGGLLAAVQVGIIGGTVTATDATWRIVRRWDRALDRDRPLGDDLAEPPVVWGAPPTGRWRPQPSTGFRPLVPALADPTAAALPVRFRSTAEDVPWQTLEPTTHPSTFDTPLKIFDWGREVEGYLTLELRPQDEQLGLLYFGTEPPEPQTRRPDELLLAVAGSRPWRSAHPHRFRYVMMVGGALRGLPSLEPLDPALAARLAPRPLETGGVWGLAPALDHLRIEELVWETAFAAR